MIWGIICILYVLGQITKAKIFAQETYIVDY